MKKSFWSNNHDQQAQYEELYDKLVPISGQAATVAGEVLRAASNIYYDFYNNGCINNRTGALAYVKLHVNIGEKWGAINQAVIYGEANLGDEMIDAYEALAEAAINFAAKEANQIPNIDDHLDYGLTDRELDEMRGVYDCPCCGMHEHDCCCNPDDYDEDDYDEDDED